MSLKKCVLKNFLKEFLQPAFIAALPKNKLNFDVAFLFITLQLTRHTL